MNENQETISAETEENAVSFQVAPKSTRILAFTLDLVLIGSLVLMLLSTFVIPKKYPAQMKELQGIIQSYTDEPKETRAIRTEEFSSDLTAMIAAMQAFTLLSFWLYFSISEIFSEGASLGKKIFSLQVINLKSAQRPRFFDSLLRGSLKTLSLLAFFPFLIVNYFLFFFTQGNRAGHDFLCNTIVVVRTSEMELDENEY